MYYAKGFAVGPDVERFFGFVVPVIGASAIAATIAAAKHAVRNVELQTFATARVSKEGLTSGTGREPIDNDWHQLALWINLRQRRLPPAILSRRCFCHQQLPLCMSPECLAASSVANPADS